MLKNKNILIIGANSDIARSLIKYLFSFNVNIFATYRKDIPETLDNFLPLFLDICDEDSYLEFKKNIKNTKFDAVVNFSGVAITSPVSNLKSDDLRHQMEVSVIAFSRFLSFIYPYLNKNSKMINISSMASFGIFPFISPYCAAKAAADIILNAFELETGIKCVSIKPGVVKTKFWQYCIDLNKDNFENFSNEYSEIGQFLLENAKNNTNKGLLPDDVAKVILKAIKSKNPKKSYLIGHDAYFASFSRFIPKSILNFLITKTLNYRVRKFKNGK